MATQMMVRIDPEGKNRFNKLDRVEGKTSSQRARELHGD
jgi:predicted DNA-binding protein